MDLALITAVITAATSAVGLFDKMADQVERFITKEPAPAVPKEHRMKIEKQGDSIVSKMHGVEYQRITAESLRALPESTLAHISVLEKSMQNHYAVWSSVYPQLALMDVGLQKAKTELQLNEVVRSMGKDLNGILSFLEDNKMELDDHYLHIRQLVKEV